MKIIFIGTVKIGHTILESILCFSWKVDLIITLDNKYRERTSGYIDFHSLAEKYNSEILYVDDINSIENIKIISQVKPDLIIVCGWQRLICKEILKIPTLGVIGFHSSLLPKYRGRAPVNWAIIMGERMTGITMFYLEEEADVGDIIAQKSFPILFNDDCNTIYEKAAMHGSEMILKYLPDIAKGTAPRIHNESKNYPLYPKRAPEDGLIDFNRSSLDVYNFVRALTKPYPGAYYYNNNGDKVTVWKISIIFDETRIKKKDIVHNTSDFKIRLLEWEVEQIKV